MEPIKLEGFTVLPHNDKGLPSVDDLEDLLSRTILELNDPPFEQYLSRSKGDKVLNIHITINIKSKVVNW